MGIPMPVESAVHEVDLSDEWAALSQQFETAMREETSSAIPEAALPPQGAQIVAPVLTPAEPAQMQAEAAAEAPAFDLELQPAAPAGVAESETLRRTRSSRTSPGIWTPLPRPWEFRRARARRNAKCRSAFRSCKRTFGSLHIRKRRSRAWKLAERSAVLWATCLKNFVPNLAKRKEDEDLETHYNLGIAYREMGLLEEAISEFQKVASSADKGPAFRYAMQCSTLLGLAFMEKGQPAIAAIWYERALKTPGLDQESILALRYDLGVAQELAGDTHAAFNSFSQVYAMNIDYRDVSERIALLGKAR